MARPAVPSRPPVKLPPKPPSKLPPKKAPAGKTAAKAKAKAKPKRRGGSEALGLVVLSGAVLFLSVVALPVCALLVVGMLPSIVAYIVDQTPRRTLTLTVGPLNLAGTAPYCLQLWFGIDTMRALGSFLGNVWVWLVMYLAAALGWLLYLGMPVIVHFLLERAIDRRKARLQQIQKKLRTEWGDEVDAAAAGPSAQDI
jgi:hypothetical protein